MKPEPNEDIFEKKLPVSPMTEIEKIDMVGSYGLTILWADDHHYGINNWHYLRALCCCPECVLKRKIRKIVSNFF